MDYYAWLDRTMKTKRRRLKYLILHEPKYTFAFGTLIGMILAVIFHIIQTHPPFLASGKLYAKLHTTYKHSIHKAKIMYMWIVENKMWAST